MTKKSATRRSTARKTVSRKRTARSIVRLDFTGAGARSSKPSASSVPASTSHLDALRERFARIQARFAERGLQDFKITLVHHDLPFEHLATEVAEALEAFLDGRVRALPSLGDSLRTETQDPLQALIDAAQALVEGPHDVVYPQRGVGGLIKGQPPFWSEEALYELVDKSAACTLLARRRKLLAAIQNAQSVAGAERLGRPSRADQRLVSRLRSAARLFHKSEVGDLLREAADALSRPVPDGALAKARVAAELGESKEDSVYVG